MRSSPYLDRPGKVGRPLIRPCLPGHNHNDYTVPLFLELWNMENKKAPQDKLNCVSRSCYRLLGRLLDYV